MGAVAWVDRHGSRRPSFAPAARGRASGWEGSGRDRASCFGAASSPATRPGRPPPGSHRRSSSGSTSATSLEERESERLAEESRRAHEAALERGRSTGCVRSSPCSAQPPLSPIGLTIFAFDQRGSAPARGPDLRRAGARRRRGRQPRRRPGAQHPARPPGRAEAEVDGVALPDAADALHQAVATSRAVLTIGVRPPRLPPSAPKGPGSPRPAHQDAARNSRLRLGRAVRRAPAHHDGREGADRQSRLQP